MPELPEVETIRLDLNSDLLNKKITFLDVLSVKTLKNGKAFFVKSLLNKSFSEINRRGKLLIFKINNDDNYLLIHLKMTGQLVYFNNGKSIAGGHSIFSEKKTKKLSLVESLGGELPNKHTRALFYFQDGSQLFFNDLRKFGYLRLVKKSALDDLIKKNYGPEPLGDDFNSNYLFDKLKNRKRNIKSILLDQKIVAGLGNIYVDESLFSAGVLPDRIANSLEFEEVDVLVKNIKRIIKLAIKYRGTTFRDYRDAQGRSGSFSKFLKVYGRESEKCLNCEAKIEKKKLAGRGTHFCLICQK